MISHGAQLAAIRDHAAKKGMKTLMDEGKHLTHRHLTDESEVRRVLQGMEDVDPAETLIEPANTTTNA